jgi:hypothetical protein
VPVSKSSMVKVPMKGSCMWVWVSIPPGMTILCEQSTTVAVLWVRF